MANSEGDNNQLHVIQGGDPMLEGFLRAAEEVQEGEKPIDATKVREFILDNHNGELIESMLFEAARLGRMSPEVESEVQRDVQAIIASITDPEVELTPSLAKVRNRFYQQVDIFRSAAEKNEQGG